MKQNKAMQTIKTGAKALLYKGQVSTPILDIWENNANSKHDVVNLRH